MSVTEVIHRLSQLLLAWKLDQRTLVYIFLALAVGFIIGRRRGQRGSLTESFQNRGEALLSRAVLSNFAFPDYHLMNHITLRVHDGTTQVDHILVSRFGVFVIETKDYKGWLFAHESQAKWTQVLFHWKFRFQNPIVQNRRHVMAVQSLLDFLPPEAVKSAVVFTGDAEFKTDIPRGVFRVPEFLGFVRGQTEEVMSLNRVQFCVGRLETERLAVTRQTDIEHIENIRRKHDDAA
ncbi:MAG: NERD domain-containing protein [Burkholderiaceae bacterium]|nr:NERD domain-containing protein [Burkholderiaceae bacterium]